MAIRRRHPRIKPGAGGRRGPAGIPAAAIVAAARSWIGTPYMHQAALRGVGCDCLGLLIGVAREVTGQEPPFTPDYSFDWAEATGEELMADGLGRHMEEVAKHERRDGDVLVFRMLPGRPAKHCGILAASGTAIIHSRQNKRVSEEPLTEDLARRIAHVFRLKQD